MKRVAVFWLALVTGAAAHAQYWKAMGKGTVGPTEVQTLYGDSASDRLLAGGTFLHILNEADTVLGFGQAAWNGSRWDSLATRIQEYGGNSAQPTRWFQRFKGDLYACGAFSVPLADGNWSRYFARLNEVTQQWDTLACKVPTECSVTALVPKRPDTLLYAVGYKYGLCGLPESGVFAYDGTSFQPWAPYDLIPEYQGNLVGFVFHFKGKTYITGLFRDPLGPDFASFLRWNGTGWEYVPGWGTYYAPIKEILVHNDILYVGGGLNSSNGGPGNGVASFDGETWNNLGGGVYNANLPSNTVVLGLQWFHNELVVCGRFTHAGGVECSSIAKWTGQQWCSYPGEIRAHWGNHPTLYEMAIWRDSLYVCGGINTVDGDTMRQVIQWIGGDAVGACSTVGVEEAPATVAALQVVPLTEPGLWSVHLPTQGSWTLTAYNTAGQRVGQWPATGAVPATIDLGNRPHGLYLLRARAATGVQLGTKLLRP